MNHLQNKIFLLLQTKAVNYIVLFFIVISVFSIIGSSYEEMAVFHSTFFALTYVSSLVFLLEYLLRIYSAPAMYPKRKRAAARLKYTFSFYGFVDFVAVCPCLLTYLCWGTEAVHLVILPYIFIVFKLLRHMKSFRIIREALVLVKDELITAYTACLILVSFSAILMYYIEHEAQPEVFRNIGDGFWWSIVAFTTTGYGDIYPITFLGKFLGSMICLVGIAMIAIPTGIISSSFMNVIQQRQREKEEKKEEKKTK